MDPEAIQRWGDVNRAYLALENEVAAVFAAEAGKAKGTVETRWEHPIQTVKGDVDRVTRARMRARGWFGALSRRSGCPGHGLLMRCLVRGPGRKGRCGRSWGGIG